MRGARLWMVTSGILALALLLLLVVQLQGPAEVRPVTSVNLTPPEDGYGFVYPGYLEAGSNEVFREGTAAAPGHELIVADLVLPANAVGDRHYHPWEEHLYVIDGSAILDIDGMEQRSLTAGEKFVIPAEMVHTPKAGPDGIRAIIIRVHDEGDPVTVPADQ
jgi:quercetin dioxygenase-like cupin family protein